MSNSRTNTIESQIDELIGEDDDFDQNTDFNQDGDEGGEDSQDQETQRSQPTEQREETPKTNPTQRKEEGSQEAKPKQVAGDLVDGKGNIVDKDGNIVAKAGGDRRLYVENRQLKAERDNLRLERQQLNEKMQQAQTFAELPRQLGMTPDEYGDGLKLMKLFKSDPVAAAKEVVARVMAMGHNAKDILGKEVGDSIDMRAIRLANEDLASRPARERADAERANNERQSAALREYNSFVSKYPDSEPHEDAIASVMGSNQVTAEVAYFQIRDFASRNGLDFSEPLGPQIEARAREAALGKTSNDRPSQRRPMGGSSGRVQDTQLTDKSEYASADDDWRSIIQGVMTN